MIRTRTPLLALVAVSLTGLLAACGGGGDKPADSKADGALAATTLNASGSTFALPFFESTIAPFSEKHSGVTINYGGGGSGKGRTDLQTGVVDFAGTDGLVKAEDAGKYKGPFLYFPTVAAPITVSYRLSGVEKLALSPATIARIFNRQIKSWDDKAIAADNPGAKLPGRAITVAHRSDGSGTTEQFTKFLKAAAPEAWTLESGSTVNWPADTQGGNGNSGVAQIIAGTDGAIGYVDFSDAKATKLATAAVKNKAGKFVEPTLAGASAALANVTVNADLSYSPIWADGDDAYPITAPTWMLAYRNQAERAKGAALAAYLRFIYAEGQTIAAGANYAKLPDALREKALAQVDALVLPA